MEGGKIVDHPDGFLLHDLVDDVALAVKTGADGDIHGFVGHQINDLELIRSLVIANQNQGDLEGDDLLNLFEDGAEQFAMFEAGVERLEDLAHRSQVFLFHLQFAGQADVLVGEGGIA